MITSLTPWLWLAAGLALAGLLLWPRLGLLWGWRRLRRESDRVRVEDALKHLYFCESEGRRPTLASIAGRLQIVEQQAADLIQQMQALDLVALHEGDLQLTPDGRVYALHIVRAHRLWERHLADETGYAAEQWHGRAEQAEHELSPAEADALASRLHNPLTDPHGDPIPTADGELAGVRGVPLSILAVGRTARIVHLEDEPEALYAQLVAEGFYPGQQIQVLERSQQRVRLWASGDEHVLAPIVAGLVTVEPLAQTAAAANGATLVDLIPPATGRIRDISPRCRGAERSRLLDLGFVPGTEVAAELISPGGDPTAYRVRDTLIALRAEQAALVRIESLPTDPATSAIHQNGRDST